MHFQATDVRLLWVHAVNGRCVFVFPKWVNGACVLSAAQPSLECSLAAGSLGFVAIWLIWGLWTLRFVRLVSCSALVGLRND